VEVLASQSRKAEPVLAGGCGRLVLDPKSAMVEGPFVFRISRNYGREAGFCQWEESGLRWI